MIRTPADAQRAAEIFRYLVRNGYDPQHSLRAATGSLRLQDTGLVVPMTEQQDAVDLYEREVARRRAEGYLNGLPRPKWL